MRFFQPLLTIFLFLAFCLPANALVESKVFNTITTEAAPLDIASSENGTWTFVLTEGGKVYIFSANGQLNDVLEVDPSADSIFVTGNGGSKLLVSSSKSKKVQLISLSFAAEINTEGSPFLGNPNAPVTLILFSDFQCPFCSKLVPVIEEVALAYPDTVKIVFKHFPLRNHRYASLAALAAIAAQQQGKFWEFHDQLFPLQKELDQDKIIGVAQNLGFDMKKFTSDVGGEDAKNQLTKDLNDGQAAGVRGTPTVFINGRQPDKLDFEEIKKAIEAELKLTKSQQK
jgi:protein-disulfide isomerase